MPQLKTLTLYLDSMAAPPFPFDVKRTVALLSLTRSDILASAGGCGLALGHLDLPALTWLCLTVISSHILNLGDVQKLPPYIARHTHGPRTPNLCRACLSAAKMITQISLRGPCPISMLRCTIRPPCSLRRSQHVWRSPLGVMTGLVSMAALGSSTQ